jgi:TonB family protein
MSSVVKENQILTSIPESGTARTVAASTTAPVADLSARPQPVALEVSVTVNGARTVAGSDKREPFSESTKTVLIFSHGAVVRLSSSVAPGQLLFLTNERTKKEVVCQVVKSKNYHNVSGYVELEFTEPVAGFWGMRFPTSAPPQSSSVTATPAVAAPPKISTCNSGAESKFTSAAPARPETKLPAPSLPRVSLPVSPTPVIPTGQSSPSLQSSSGSKLQIPAPVVRSQSSPATTVSGTDKVPNVVEISKSKSATLEVVAPAKNAAPPAKSILDSDEVKIPSWLEPLARNAAIPSAALPEVASKQELKHEEPIAEVEDLSVIEVADNRGVTAPSFGSHFLAEESEGFATEASTSGKSSKKFLIAAIAAGALLLVGAGGWYMRQSSGSGSSNSPTVTNTAAVDAGNAAQPQTQVQGSTPTPSSPSGTYTAVSTPTPSGAPASSGISATNSVVAANPSSNLNKRIVTADALPPSVPQPKKPTLGEVNLSSPIVNRLAATEDHAEEALNLETSSQAAPGSGLALDLVSNSRQPVAPAAPLPIGGAVKSARLISSVAPRYPTIAKSQRVAGDVKIDALIDAAGHVSSMKIVSGPTMLQESAMDALRHWKYEPALLDGKAVPMHLTVTIQFKLQ